MAARHPLIGQILEELGVDVAVAEGSNQAAAIPGSDAAEKELVKGFKGLFHMHHS